VAIRHLNSAVSGTTGARGLPAGDAALLRDVAGAQAESRPSAASRERLRIALLGYRSKPHAGGQGVYLHYLSRALVEAGHSVDVISGPPYPELDPRVRLIRLPSLDLYENGLRSLRPAHCRSLSNLIEWFSKLTGGFAEPYTFGRRALKYLRQHGHEYDLLHDNQSLSDGMLGLQRLGFPLVTTIHHPITHDRRIALEHAVSPLQRLLIRRWHSFLRMQKRVARRLHHVVTVSECSRRDIALDFGRSEDAIEVIHNGIDTDLFRPLPEIERRPGRIMVTVSADAPLKGMRYLLQALASLVDRHPDLELLAVSRLEPGGETEQLITRLGLRDRIEFVSGLSGAEMAECYASAALVVVPSLYEGFGLPAGEAMACGLPVIATDGGALPEVVGDAGVIVPRGDAGALAAAIDALLRDADRRETLGRQARERILQQFSWQVCAHAMVSYYRNVLQHADARS
jgi:glycosyltransferase involved in cell wall biosynthesis